MVWCSRSAGWLFSFTILVAVAFLVEPTPLAAQCTPNPTNNTVRICSPLNNASVTSPFTVSAVATSSAAVSKFLVYLDNTLVYQQLNTKSVSTSVTASPGSHKVTAQYYNGAWVVQSIFVTVTSGSGVSVSVTPSSATIAGGANQQFSATVTGTTNTSVTWAVDGLFGGNTSVGTISTSGLYTAPPTAGSHTITATSAADSTKTGAASVTVTTSSGCTGTGSNNTVTICSPANNSTVASPIHVAATANSTATVSKFLVYLDSVLKYQALNTKSIDTMVTAAAGKHNLVVQYYNGAWVVASETVTVTSSTGGVSITISPTSAALATGGTQQFTAAVTGSTNTSVTWSVDGTAGGSSAVGTVSTSGLYTAPGTAGTHTVTATSAADATKSASATVTVMAPGGCSTGGANNTLSICSPANGASIPSPIHVVAQANSTAPVGKFLVYLDSVLVYQILNSSSVDTMVTASAGQHSLVLQYYNGAWVKAAETITVTQGGGGNPIQHVIFMLQENRSFDTYFGMLNPYRQTNGWNIGDDGKQYDVDGIDDKLTKFTNVDDEGASFGLFKFSSSCIDDMSSAWLESFGDVNRFDFSTTRKTLMDGFVHTAENFGKNDGASDLTGRRAMGYYDQTFLNYYYYMASQFAVSDRWFSPMASKSTPNRIATLTGGTTQGLVRDPANDDHFGQLGVQTIFQELDNSAVPWRVYYSTTEDQCLADPSAPCSASTPDKYPATTLTYFTFTPEVSVQESNRCGMYRYNAGVRNGSG